MAKKIINKADYTGIGIGFMKNNPYIPTNPETDKQIFDLLSQRMVGGPMSMGRNSKINKTNRVLEKEAADLYRSTYNKELGTDKAYRRKLQVGNIWFSPTKGKIMKNAVNNLKCGGKVKAKKFQYGGINRISTSNIKYPMLSSGIDNKTLAPGPDAMTSAKGINPVTMGADFLSDTLGGVLDERKAALIANMDNREDPNATMKKTATMDSVKAVAAGAAKGAAIGSVVPVIGTAIGAIGGAAVAGLGRLFGSKQRGEDRTEGTQDWSDSWSAKTAAGMRKTGYKKGGFTKDTMPEGDHTRKPSSFNVYKNVKYPLTDINVVNKMVERGYHNDKGALLKMTPEERQKLIPEGSSITYEKVKKGTANQGGYKYYESGRVMVGPENSFNMTPVARLNTGMKSGGLIKGKGTGKSDSIDMKLEEGAFIVPAENADYAEELGATYLGWDKEERAKRNYKQGGSVDAKVSNGEVYYTKDETNILRYHGINLDELAPKAENKIEMKKGGSVNSFKNGTKEPESSPWIYNKESDLAIDDKTKTAYDRSGAEHVFNVDENKYVKLKGGSPYGIGIYDQTKNPDKKDDDDIPSWMKNIPELAGTIQTAGGLAGLIEAGKAPDLHVSRTLNKLSGEVRRLSEFGYEPKVLNALNQEIENTRRNLSVGIEGQGGSGIEKMAKLNTLLSTTIDKKAGLAFADAAEKTRKWADVLKVDTMKAGQEFDINKIKLEDYYKNQEMFAGLVNAGISNIVGARQLKSEQSVMREIGTSKPTRTPYEP